MKLSTIYYKIKQGIINCYRWFYVIWNDRQYDGMFIFIILDQKLRFMIEHLENTPFQYEGIDQDLERMKNCLELLDEVITVDGEINVINKLEDKWGVLDMNIKEDGTVEFNREGVNTEEEYKQCREDDKKWTEEEQEKQNKRVHQALNIIENNWRKWWT